MRGVDIGATTVKDAKGKQKSDCHDELTQIQVENQRRAFSSCKKGDKNHCRHENLMCLDERRMLKAKT